MSGRDRDVVDFRYVGRDMEDHETDDTNALSIRFGLGDKAGYKTVVIEQPIIAVDGPVRKMLPGALDVDDPVDVAFASLTNSDFQCFHEQSPRPACAHTPAKGRRRWEWLPIPRPFRRDTNALNGFSIPAPVLRIRNESLRHRKKPAVVAAKTPPTRRVVDRRPVVRTRAMGLCLC